MTGLDRAITFDCEGEQLIGIVSGPGAGKVGVLVVVGGPQYRVGAARQFVLFARRLAAGGIPVMRFDYRGMGDSTGNRRTFHDTGPDIAAAIGAFKAACSGLERVVLWGLCDGASASLLYWNDTADVRVAGMVLLNPWVTSDEAHAQAEVTRALRRFVQRAFWVKLMRGGIDLVGAARSFAQQVGAALRRSIPADANEPFQGRMASGLEAFGGPVLVVLSGRDITCAQFLALCDADPRWRAILSRSNVERHRIDDADHTFSDAASRHNLEAANIAWFEHHFRQGVVRKAPSNTNYACHGTERW